VVIQYTSRRSLVGRLRVPVAGHTVQTPLCRMSYGLALFVSFKEYKLLTVEKKENIDRVLRVLLKSSVP
jgi:hypothetical protein